MTLWDLLLIFVVVGLGAWVVVVRRENRQLQKSLAQQAEEANRSLAGQHIVVARLDAVIDAPSHVLVVLDQNGLITQANARALEMMGNTAIGRTTIEATRSHEVDEVVQNTLRSRVLEERPVTWNARPYLARVVPITNGGAVLSLEDQTERRRLEHVRRDFVANVSHELRTPLAALRLLVETLLNGALAEPELGPRMLNQMLGEVDSMTQLAQELLDLSMIESGQLPMQVARANLREIVAEQILHYEPMAQQKQLQLKDDVPAELIAEVDRKMIGRVLGNLIHNAIKFTLDRGHITVGAGRDGDQIKVWVADSGGGIPAEDLPRIFERFYKVDRARGKSGTGLGLAIARHVVEAHGGRIWAESVEGQGTTFYFTLPTAK